jgi:hypothetical protein
MLIFSCDLFDPEGNDDEIIIPLPQYLMIDNTGIPDWYPSIHTKSVDEDEIFDSVYQAFKLEYNVDSTARFDIEYLDLCSHLYHCYFWSGIQLYDTTMNQEKPINNEEFAENLILTWWQLFSNEGFEISRTDCTSWHYGAYNRYKFYIKNQYDYPIWQQNSLLGMISLKIDSTMTLRELSSNLAPHLPIPKNPMYDADSAKAKAVGFEWHYHGYSGERIDCVVDSSDVRSASLKVYIDRKSDEYVYRLIWCISTNGLPIDIIYDAMTGEFIRYIQNFRT